MTNRDVVNFCNARQIFGNKKLPVRLAFALKLNYEKLKTCADAHNKQFAEIKKKYTKENGELTDDTKELEEFAKDIDELMSTKVACDIQKVDISLLEKCDQDQFDSLSLDEVEILNFMIE